MKSCINTDRATISRPRAVSPSAKKKRKLICLGDLLLLFNQRKFLRAVLSQTR